MYSLHHEKQVETARDQHLLSDRAVCNFVHRDIWGPREKSMGNPWFPTNPTGTVNLRLAENSLMHEEIGQFIKNEHRPTRVAASPTSSSYISNREFRPLGSITADDIFITPGLASAIDAVAWSTCNDGDGILVPQPFYNGFQFDLLNRSSTRVVPVSYTGVEGYSGLDDLFYPEVNRKALERALNKAREDGIDIRAVLISNPHNPLGRCYPPSTLKEFARFCGLNKLHLISDEIYAKSVFENPSIPNSTPFSSILALDTADLIHPTLVHVLYGASKDFCANGLRLGVVYTRNKGIIGAMSSISMFSWSPHVLQDVWAGMLEDVEWMNDFMKKKNYLVLENYKLTSSFLRDCGIEYYEMNAGLFFWIDLRHILKPDYSGDDSLSASSSNGNTYKEREARVVDICMKHGVLIAPGHVYVPEEFGWFRITFTVGKEALQEGLQRIKASLDEVKKEAQSWE